MAIFKKPKLTESSQTPPSKARHTIMLVDDEPANLIVLSSILEDEFDLITASNGREALDIIAGLQYPEKLRLVISDQRMPLMTGTELLEILGQTYPHILRILLTGYADIDAIMDGINKAQIYRYICKPFDRNDMLLTVRRAIELLEAEEARKAAEDTSSRHLQRINEVLSSTNRLKDLFLATISHELRTPMHGVVGNLELLRQTEMSEQAQEWLAEASDSAQRMRELLDEILGYTELQAGTLKLKPTDTALMPLLNSVADFARHASQQKGLQFSFTISDQVPTHIVIDAEQLVHILRHLLENAVKFTDTGSVTLEVGFFKSASGGELAVRVADTGRGISAKEQETLYERFQQHDQRFNRRHGGLGLGLAIVHRLTQLFNGQLRVESEVGRGSNFTLTLPVELDVSPILDPQSNPISVVSLKGLKVLVVDDNPVNRKVIQAMLRHLGCETMCACNGVEALETTEQHSFHIILMDCQMPVMDGFEATQRLKQRQAYIKTPVIAFTANASQKDWERAQACGMCDLLKKPVTLAQLTECLSSWVSPQ